MKRLMIVFAALAAVACAKNNVAEDPAPAEQYLNLTVSDFPALESATRSGETVGKTAWEDGDELLIEFIKHANGGDIFTDDENIVSGALIAQNLPRIVRINGDGSVRMILEGSLNKLQKDNNNINLNEKLKNTKSANIKLLFCSNDTLKMLKSF